MIPQLDLPRSVNFPTEIDGQQRSGKSVNSEFQIPSESIRRQRDSTSSRERKEGDDRKQISNNHRALLREENQMRETKSHSEQNRQLPFEQQRNGSNERENGQDGRERPEVRKSLQRKVLQYFDEVQNARLHGVTIPGGTVDLLLLAELMEEAEGIQDYARGSQHKHPSRQAYESKRVFSGVAERSLFTPN